MRPENTASNKRKHEGQIEQPRPSPQQRSQTEKPSPQVDDIPAVDGMDFEPLDIFANPDPIATAGNVATPASTMQDFSWNQYSNINSNRLRCPTPTSPTAKSNVIVPSRPAFRPLQQASISSVGLTRPYRNLNPQKQTVTIPARLVPEQSVSPRTQAVEIPSLPYAPQVQAQQTMLLQRAINTNSQPGPSSHTPGPNNPMNRNKQFQIPRSVPPQALFPVGPPRPPQAFQTYSSDIQRRPSLYKIPPWPSPSSPAAPNQPPSSATRSPTPNAHVAHSMLSINSSVSAGVRSFADQQRANMINAQRAMLQGLQIGAPTPRMMPVTPPRTPQLQDQARSSSSMASSPPTLPQENPNKRKHSPNM